MRLIERPPSWPRGFPLPRPNPETHYGFITFSNKQDIYRYYYLWNTQKHKHIQISTVFHCPAQIQKPTTASSPSQTRKTYTGAISCEIHKKQKYTDFHDNGQSTNTFIFISEALVKSSTITCWMVEHITHTLYFVSFVIVHTVLPEYCSSQVRWPLPVNQSVLGDKCIGQMAFRPTGFPIPHLIHTHWAHWGTTRPQTRALCILNQRSRIVSNDWNAPSNPAVRWQYPQLNVKHAQSSVNEDLMWSWVKFV